MSHFTPVILESPYSGNFARNIRYARLCVRDSVMNYSEAPYASHLLYTQALDDRVGDERVMGIHAGFALSKIIPRRVFYVDLGWSEGMNYGRTDAEKLGQEIIIRHLPHFFMQKLDTKESFGSPEW